MSYPVKGSPTKPGQAESKELTCLQLRQKAEPARRKDAGWFR